MIVLSGCKPLLYVPNHQNTPVFREKGEIAVNIGAANFQAAYAPVENIGVVANGQVATRTFDNSSSIPNRDFTQWTTNRNFLELGAGTWQLLDDRHTFSMYAGAGYGTVKFERVFGDTLPLTSNYSNNVTRYFIQPAFSWTSEYADVIFATRISGVRYSNVDTTNFSFIALESEELDNVDGKTHAFVEPTLTLRAGYRYVKLFGQAGIALKIDDQDLTFNPLMMTIGVHLHFSRRWDAKHEGQ